MGYLDGDDVVDGQNSEVWGVRRDDQKGNKKYCSSFGCLHVYICSLCNKFLFAIPITLRVSIQPIRCYDQGIITIWTYRK